jgi:hypothetical protein
VNTDKHKLLLDNLQSLLEKQIEMARKGNYSHIELLSEQAGSAIEELAKIDSSDSPDFENRRKHLLKLYEKLELMLAAEQNSVKDQQKQVDNVRKILSAYRNSS